MEWSDGKITFKGEAEELLGLLRDSSVDAANILPTKQFHVSQKTFILSSIVFLLLACIGWCLNSYLVNYRGIEFILLLSSGGVVCACCHGCYRNRFVDLLCGIVSVLVLCVSMHLNTPEEATAYLREKVDKTVEREANIPPK